MSDLNILKYILYHTVAAVLSHPLSWGELKRGKWWFSQPFIWKRDC